VPALDKLFFALEINAMTPVSVTRPVEIAPNQTKLTELLAMITMRALYSMFALVESVPQLLITHAQHLNAKNLELAIPFLENALTY
jgi:hypothetical protein